MTFSTVQYSTNGTTNIMSDTHKGVWFYVSGGIVGSDAQIDNQKYIIAKQVEDYLNGGDRPSWLDDAEFHSTKAMFPDGLMISAMGPVVDRNPPSCHWVQDESTEAHQQRVELMNLLRGTP